VSTQAWQSISSPPCLNSPKPRWWRHVGIPSPLRCRPLAGSNSPAEAPVASSWHWRYLLNAQTGNGAPAEGGSAEQVSNLLDEARAIARHCPDPGRLPALIAQVRRARTPRAPASMTEARTPPALSERERELLPLLAGTLSQREIGVVLHLSVNTVKTHSRVLFRKLGVSNRADAVRRAREVGLLSPPIPGAAGR
jgi:DNA-binding CsgD family transcriptional regulator